jgi:hypothetical protein
MAQKIAISIRLLLNSRVSRMLLLNFSISIFQARTITGENWGFSTWYGRCRGVYYGGNVLFTEKNEFTSKSIMLFTLIVLL